MCAANYKPVQFNYVNHYTSGTPSSPSASARFAYYNVTAVPTLKFDGTATVVGGQSSGEAYMAVIAAHHAEMTPLMMAVTDWSFTSGAAFAEVLLRLYGDLDDITNSYIRIAVVESSVSGYPHVLRALLPDQPLTISQDGQEQIVNVPFSIGGGWNVANLFLVAFVQRDTDKHIFNSANNKVGNYAALAGYGGPRLKPLDDGEAVFDPIRVYNMGYSADTYDITLDVSGLPSGWNAYLSHEGQTASSLQISLDSLETVEFGVIIDASTNASANVVLNVHSQGADELAVSWVFGAMTAGADILIVSDDNQAGYAQSHYGPILDDTPLQYAIWERSLAAVSGADLLNYDAVIWTTGAYTGSMQDNDRAALDVFLDNGGRLIMAGENLLQGIAAQGSVPRNWFLGRFQFNYGGTYSGSRDVVGVEDDPVGDGLAFTLTGGDPDRLTYLSGPRPIEVSCFYANDRPAVIRTDHDGYLSVYFSFGLELVPTQADRDALLKRSLEWLGVLQMTPVPDAPDALTALLPNRPNPFNPATEIAFALGQSGAVRLEIFNARGQLVRTLLDQVLSAGQHTATWDGRTDLGRSAASGTYFYRLSTPAEQLTRKMSLIK